MAKNKSLSDGPAPSPLAESAARFEELARSLKAQQLAENQGAPVAAAPLHVAAPDELWARRYLCQGIGAAGTEAVASLAPVPHARMAPPDFSALRQSVIAPKPVLARRLDAAADIRPAPIGVRLGKTERPPRSWLGRLFRST